MSVLDTTARLNASLDEVAAALSAPDAEALLAAETGLAAALTELARPSTVTADERSALAAEVIRARATLARCRILGASAADVALLSLAAQGRAGDYGRSGEPAPSSPDGALRHHLRARL